MYIYNENLLHTLVYCYHTYIAVYVASYIATTFINTTNIGLHSSAVHNCTHITRNAETLVISIKHNY